MMYVSKQGRIVLATLTVVVVLALVGIGMWPGSKPDARAPAAAPDWEITGAVVGGYQSLALDARQVIILLSLIQALPHGAAGFTGATVDVTLTVAPVDAVLVDIAKAAVGKMQGAHAGLVRVRGAATLNLIIYKADLPAPVLMWFTGMAPKWLTNHGVYVVRVM